MEIKLASQNDYEEILTMCTEFETSPFTFDLDFVSIANGKKINPSFAEKILLSPYSMSLILKENENNLGFITVSVNPTISNLTTIKIGNITLLVIKKKFRGNGLGKLLIEKGLAFLKSYGVKLVSVGTDIYNISAIKSYEKCGFRFQMGWHIFRHFIKDFDPSEIAEEIEPLETPKILNKFFTDFDRPFSLLKEKHINTKVIKEYLFNNLITNILKGKIKALSYRKNKKTVGILTYQYDELSQNALSSDKSVVKILDIMCLQDNRQEKEKIATILLNDIKNRLYNTHILEMWLSAENQTLIKTLERNDFQLSYTGVHLHKEL
ncbi:MAG: GNAT family N-acetyltransferase [Brevinematales bacterium]|nr:GNAT family N-acetyltransferase [Brevinematales bacterium]